MPTKSLVSTNAYLARANAPERLALNLATTTAVETGRPVDFYLARYRSRHGIHLVGVGEPKPVS